MTQRFSRRAALTLGGAAFGGVSLAALELASLRGRFDHTTMPSVAERFAWNATLRALADPRLAAGALVPVGHSTHLVCLSGRRFLTDPWFYDPAFGSLRHTAGPAVRPVDVGRLDAILVSHDHADHADRRALAELDPAAILVVGQAPLAASLEALGRRGIVLLEPWKSTEVGPVRITAVPALHDVEEVGFVLEGGARTVYFAGDTALFDGISEIGERFAPDLAILPVDGTRRIGEPRLVMNPEDAVTASRQLRARAVLPSHADARVSDVLARGLLVETVADASSAFRRLLAADLPRVQCVGSKPCEPIAIAPAMGT